MMIIIIKDRIERTFSHHNLKMLCQFVDDRVHDVYSLQRMSEIIEPILIFQERNYTNYMYVDS